MKVAKRINLKSFIPKEKYFFLLLFLKYKFIYFNWKLITLQYCIGFAIHQHESTTGIHAFPILSVPSLLPPCTIPLGHPSAPAPSIQYHALNLEWQLVSYMIFYISMPFSRYIYTMEYYSAIKKNTFESVLMSWMKLEPIIQSEVSQKEKHQYSILTHIYGI